ncbi:MAG: hypothetical protein EBS01_13225 [Verrucomicrobia bacterium]|nr:hypothetical protein [Verrucomicrobiota bacterium]
MLIKTTQNVSEPEFADTKQVTAKFQLSKASLERLEKSGAIKAVRLSITGAPRRKFYDLASVRALFASAAI